MSKKVALIYGDRHWLVCYEPTGQNEFFAFQVALMDIVECDPYLVRMLDTHYPVVLFYDLKYHKLFELNTTSRMPPPDSTLWLKFIACWDDENLDHLMATKLISPNAGFFDKEKAVAVEAEAGKARIRDLQRENFGGEQTAIGVPELKISPPNPANSKGCDKKRSWPDEQSAKNGIQLDVALKSSKPRRKSQFVLTQQFELPVFTNQVQNAINQGKLKLTNIDFINEASDHLMSIIDNRNPIASDLKIFCIALVQKYPELKDFNKKTGREYETLKQFLSRAIRNKRNSSKKTNNGKVKQARRQNRGSLQEPPVSKSSNLRVKPLPNYMEPCSSPEDDSEEIDCELHDIKMEF